MANNPILGYARWNKLNESTEPEAIYFTVDFSKNVDLAELLERAIRLSLEEYSSIFKLTDATPTSFTLVLNVDEELGSVLTQLGGLKPIVIDLNIPKFTYNKIADLIKANFPMISENAKKEIFTYLLSGDKVNFTDVDIINYIISSGSFATFLQSTSNINNSKKIDFQEAKRFLTDFEKVESVFYLGDRDKSTTLLSDFKRALLTMVYQRLFIELIKEIGSFKRVEIHLSDFAVQLTEKINLLERKIGEYWKNKSKELAREIVTEIFEFQKKLTAMLNSVDVRRRLAANGIVKTYDLFQQMGLSANDAMDLIKEPE